MYFSGVPRVDWPRGVDAQRSARSKEDVATTSSESEGADAGRTETLPLVMEKVWGKRVAADEPA